MSEGVIARISGPVVVGVGLGRARMYDVVRVGELGLIGEVIRLEADRATIQVYEETSGLRIGEPVESAGSPLRVELGPGLLGSIFDGIERPLPRLREDAGDFIPRGISAPALDRSRRWEFRPTVAPGDVLHGGDVVGEVDEGALVHRVMVPPDESGRVVDLRPGPASVDDVVAVLERPAVDGAAPPQVPIRLRHAWPVRVPRPFARKLDPDLPLLTGQRILDTMYPVAKGGVAVIPGGFGTGKTVLEQTLAKWADADVVVYVACGERGNEVAELLRTFPALMDQRTGRPLLERTVLIANTSNMPVAAREASIYTGITIAEYYRDMGYDVAVMADSTSRWGEALREVSGRLEEMPGEEGYPAYLATRLAAFYERSGRIACLGAPDRLGSITTVGAVSPPGGDFSEPMTQHSLRIAGTFWALDTDLAHRRHFPAISWTRSYSLYLPTLAEWYAREVAPGWRDARERASRLLQREIELQEIVQVVGSDALPEREKAILEVGRILREDFLQQSALDPIDGHCSLAKQQAMLDAVLRADDAVQGAVDRGVATSAIFAPREVAELARMKELPEDVAPARIAELAERIVARIGSLEA